MRYEPCSLDRAGFIKKRLSYKKSVNPIIQEIKRVLLQEIFQLFTLKAYLLSLYKECNNKIVSACINGLIEEGFKNGKGKRIK